MKPLILIALAASLSGGKRNDLQVQPYSKYEVVGVCIGGGTGSQSNPQAVYFNYNGTRHMARLGQPHPYGCAFVVEVDTQDFLFSNVVEGRPILEGSSRLSEVIVHSTFFIGWEDIHYSYKVYGKKYRHVRSVSAADYRRLKKNRKKLTVRYSVDNPQISVLDLWPKLEDLNL